MSFFDSDIVRAEMAEIQADQDRSLFDDSYIVREQHVKVRSPRRLRFKTIPYTFSLLLEVYSNSPSIDL